MIQSNVKSAIFLAFTIISFDAAFPEIGTASQAKSWANQIRLSDCLRHKGQEIAEAKSEILANETLSSSLKSEALAFHLSLWSTLAPAVPGAYWSLTTGNSGDLVVPVIMMSGGFIFGPSIGHFYAHKPGRGVRGIGLRFGTAVAATVLSVALGKPHDSGAIGGFSLPEPNPWIIAIGGCGVVASAAFDIRNTKQSVKKYNQAHTQKASISAFPKYFSDSNAIGLGLKVTF